MIVCISAICFTCFTYLTHAAKEHEKSTTMEIPALEVMDELVQDPSSNSNVAVSTENVHIICLIIPPD